MAKAKSVHSTPPISTSKTTSAAAVHEGLFELEDRLLRVRDLVQATRMLASAWEIDKQARGALEALAWTVLDEIQHVIDERTRLTHLAAKVAKGGSDAES